MAQEFTIKSTAIEDKINQLLPSQGGFEPGVDFSASTMVIPVVDLTETAEGSALRQDLQRAMSLTNITAFSIQNATNTTIINTPGYYALQLTVMGVASSSSSTQTNMNLNITDGTTTKELFNTETITGNTTGEFVGFYIPPLTIKLEAGETLRGSADLYSRVAGTVNQIADINGNLT